MNLRISTSSRDSCVSNLPGPAMLGSMSIISEAVSGAKRTEDGLLSRRKWEGRLLKIWGIGYRSRTRAKRTRWLVGLIIDDVPLPIKFEVATLEKHVL